LAGFGDLLPEVSREKYYFWYDDTETESGYAVVKSGSRKF
jgi:hypothetical protein